MIAEKGARIVAVADHTGGVCRDSGLDVRALIDWVSEQGGVAGFPGGDAFDGVSLVRAAAGAGIELDGRRVLVVGAGGAGRAIALAVARCRPARLSIANRTASRAIELAEVVSELVSTVAVEVAPTANPSAYSGRRTLTSASAPIWPSIRASNA